MAASDRADEHEYRLLWRRRMMFIVLLLLAVGASVWFVRWLSEGIGMNRIGEHYKQADDY